MGLCCADGRTEAGTGGGKLGRSEALECGTGGGAATGASGAFLPELFVGIKREPVQVELSALRVLSELLGFLLSVKSFAPPGPPDMPGDLRLQCPRD